MSRNQVAGFSTDTATGIPGLPSISGATTPMIATQPRIQTQAGLDLGKVMQQLGSSTYQAASVLGNLSTKTASTGLSLQEGQAIGVEFSNRYEEKNFEVSIPTEQGNVNLRDFTIDRIGAYMEANEGNLGQALHQTTIDLISVRIPADATPAEQAAYLRRSYTPIVNSMGKYYVENVLGHHKEAIQSAWVTAFADTGKVVSSKQIWEVSKSANQGYWSRDEVPQIMAQIATEHADDGNYDIALAQLDAIPDKPEFDKLRADTAKKISEQRAESVSIAFGQQLDLLDTELYWISESVLDEAAKVALDPNIDGADQIVSVIQSWASNTPMSLRQRDAILDRIGQEAAFRTGYNAGDEFAKMRRTLPDEAKAARDESAIRDFNRRNAEADIFVFLEEGTIAGHDLSEKTEEQKSEALKAHLKNKYGQDWAQHWRTYENLSREETEVASTDAYDKIRVDIATASSGAHRQLLFEQLVLSPDGTPMNTDLTHQQIFNLHKMVGTDPVDFMADGSRDFSELESRIEDAFIAASGGKWELSGGRKYATWEFVGGQPPQFETRRLELMNAVRDDIADFQDEAWLKRYRAMTLSEKRNEIRQQYDTIRKKYLGVSRSDVGDGTVQPDWVNMSEGQEYGYAIGFGFSLRPQEDTDTDIAVPTDKKDSE